MSSYVLAQVISAIANVFSILVFLSIVLSWFMLPDHPVREAIDRIVEPFLNPIRRIVPAMGMFDFSPMILLILIQFISQFLINILTR
ncbi:MAG: YggT family protein [Chloroflexi bacterium]|nr:YggT family protein [Chloroflexota bacterium]MBI3341123.1 YggT family protein [Chloroflexota bacterium]